MTKAELRSLVKNRLRRIDKTRKYHDNIINAELARVITTFYNEVYRNDSRDLDFYTTEVTFNTAAILTNANTSEKYVNIPSGKKFMNLPDIRKGVRSVNALSTLSMTFYPYTTRTLQQFIGLEAEDTLLSTGSSTRIGYKVLDNKIEFYGMPTSVSNEGIVANVIYDFFSLNDTDEVNLPGGQDATIIDAVVSALSQVPPVDLENDNNDNPNG